MRVTLNGYIVPDDDAWIYEFFGYNVVSPAKVRQAIADTPEGEALTLEFNSSGGSVFAGFEIFSVLKAATVETVAEVQSLAASAASTAMVGCKKVLLSPVAQVMIHLPSIRTAGNRNDHFDSIDLLDAIAGSIIAGYETRCKGKRSRTELEAMMAATTWLTAQQAVDAGLADGILYQDEPDVDPNQVYNAIGAGIRAATNSGSGLPDIAQLRAAYQQMQPQPQPSAADEPAGTEPVEDSDEWQAQARLSIEKLRF